MAFETREIPAIELTVGARVLRGGRAVTAVSVRRDPSGDVGVGYRPTRFRGRTEHVLYDPRELVEVIVGGFPERPRFESVQTIRLLVREALRGLREPE